MNELMEILEELRPDVDFENETALITDGMNDIPSLPRKPKCLANGRGRAILLTSSIDAIIFHASLTLSFLNTTHRITTLPNVIIHDSTAGSFTPRRLHQWFTASRIP